MTHKRRSPGDGSIYQRADGKWIATAEIGERFGPRRRRYFVGRTREAVRQRLLRAQRDGIPRGASTTLRTVGDLLDEWLETARVRTAHRTYTGYLDIANAAIRPHLGSVPLDRIDATTIERVLRAWASAPSRRKGGPAHLSPKTLASRLSALKSALRLAVERHILSWNPAAAVRAPRIPEYNATVLTPAQFAQLLRAAQTREGDYRAIFLVAAAAGLRRGEICALRWRDFDPKSRRLTIGASIEIRRPKPYKLAEKAPKGNRAADVMLPAIAVEALERHRAAQARHLVGVTPETRIFDDDGQTMNPDKLAKRLAKTVRRAGVPHVRLHDLRHAFGTWMVNEGVSTRIVQRQMRHADPRMTARYTRHIDDGAHAAADALDELLRNALEPELPQKRDARSAKKVSHRRRS